MVYRIEVFPEHLPYFGIIELCRAKTAIFLPIESSKIQVKSLILMLNETYLSSERLQSKISSN